MTDPEKTDVLQQTRLCPHCGDFVKTDTLVEGQATMGSEIPKNGFLSEMLDNSQVYQVNKNAFYVNVCRTCIKKQRLKFLGFVFGGTALGCLIMSLEWVMDLQAWGYVVGGIIAASCFSALFKISMSTTEIADQLAIHVVRRNLPNEMKKDKKFTFFTRSDLKKMY